MRTADEAVRAAMPGEPEVVVVPDASAAASEAARRIALALSEAIAARGAGHFVTTGGSTPAGIHAALRSEPLRGTVAWSCVHLWVGDERVVPWTDPRCNMAAAVRTLIEDDGVPIPPGHVHPWPVDETLTSERGAAWAAERLAAEAAALVPGWSEGSPRFDAVIVGIGADGHLLSVFPGSAAFDSAALTLAIPAPTHIEPRVERVTFGPAVLDGAGTLLAVAHGAGKAGIVAEILAGPRDERRLPAQRARRAGATWILDEAAAARLEGRDIS